MIRIALPAASAPRDRAGGDRLADVEHRAARRLAAPHREAVHRGVVPGRQIDRRHHVAREHAAVRVRERDALRHDGSAAARHRSSACSM